MKARGVFLSAALLACTAPAGAEEPKVDCAKAEIQIELNYCAEKDYEAADKALNAIWKTARAAAAAKDKDLDAVSRGAEAALLKAQRAWIDYRDAACDTESFSVRGGTAETMVLFGCKAELTRTRTGQLKNLVELFGE